MITSLLIANRGEIAVRIIRTCRRLHIRAVAVYSEADRLAPHVALADAAYCIGPAESTASYLNPEAIIAAAKHAQVDAIHPGYGFLSENEALISRCEQESIIFIGPNREAIRLMGSKLEAKHLAQRAGVPVIPGYHGDDQNEAALAKQADTIAYPLMIKASAGGGGKGMRRVDSSAEFIDALKGAKQEALASFGDDTVLLEKLITAPRHIEVQIAGDQHGATVHLYERECSIQRNHQKVIEEAPSAFISEAQREALFRSAITLAKAINYDSLGTVEFLLDHDSGEIYFLEMNTRLQVEHPVTEYITGLDLVEWQIRIAAGEALPLTQEEITQTGWAIEARINAEDPANNYQPQTGLISRYVEPGVNAGTDSSPADLRIDSAVHNGSEITPYYDSMIAKVIARGNNREQARVGLLDAVEQFSITGIGTNLDFVADILRQSQFSDAALTTGFLETCFPGGWAPPALTPETALLAAIAYTAMRENQDISKDTPISPWQSLGSFRVLENAGLSANTRLVMSDSQGNIITVAINRADATYRANSDELEIEARTTVLPGGKCLIEVDNQTHSLAVQIESDRLIIDHGDKIQRWTLLDQHQLALGKNSPEDSGDHRITAALPGQVVELCCEIGDEVKAGDTLAVLDSMKLLHKLCAQSDGTVRGIFCAVDDNVENGALLIELETRA